MAARIARTPFVGRQRELTTLLERLAAAGRGEGNAVLIAGEPGIGKTRLLTELAGHARSRGWTVLSGRAYDSEGMPPYLPFIEGVREYVRACPDDDLRAQLGAGASDLALLVPELRDRFSDAPPGPAVSPEQQRYWLFEHVCDFLLAVARSRPPGLLLIVDDLHWADRPTLLLLLHLARKLTDAPVMLAAGHRTVDLDRTHPLADLLADLSREHLSYRLPLAALSADEAAVLVEALSGSAPAPLVLDAIYQKTEGNAFFLEEVTYHLLEAGTGLTDPRSVLQLTAPESVRQVIGRRLARQDRETNEILQVAAILGDGFTLDVLGAAGGVAVLPLLDALDHALRAGLLEQHRDGYQFTHALIRQTLYEGLPPHRRQRLHLGAAVALEGTAPRNRQAQLAALASHYRLAGPVAGPRKALTYSRQAGDAAAGVFAWEGAILHWQAALNLLADDAVALDPGEDTQRCELLLALGAAQERAGDHEAALAAFLQACDLARTLQAHELFAHGALIYGEIVTNRRTGLMHQLAVDLLEEALRAAGDQATPLQARLQSCLAYALYWSDDPERREALSDAALAAARRTGDPATLAYVLNQHCQTLQSLRRFDARHAAAGELVELGERLQSRTYVLLGQFWHIAGHLELGDTAAASAALDAHERLADELRWTFYQVLTVAWRAEWALLAGRLEESETLAEETRAIWQRTTGEVRNPWFLFHRVALRRAQGRLAEVEVEVLEMVARRPLQIAPQIHNFAALVHSLSGREAAARETFAAQAAHGIATLAGSAYNIQGATTLAEVCAILKDRERAPRLYDTLRPFAGRNVVVPFWPQFHGAVDHYLGLLAATIGRWDEATRHFDVALAMHARVGARPFLARTQHAYAAMLLERRGAGDLARARSLLEEAIASFDEIGMVQDAAAARALLADPRTAAPPSRPIFPDGLSEREVEVLRLVAAGKGNREIAAVLVISRNTVLRHVNHLYAKTGVANRVELANYAHRHGLTE